MLLLGGSILGQKRSIFSEVEGEGDEDSDEVDRRSSLFLDVKSLILGL